MSLNDYLKFQVKLFIYLFNVIMKYKNILNYLLQYYIAILLLKNMNKRKKLLLMCRS